MPYNHHIPDAPIGLSMLPRAAAADLKKNDLLYLVKPGNNIGERCKSLELETLFSSDLFKSVGVRNSIIKSNILAYTGALATTSSNQYTEICHLDIDPRLDVEFHVWGNSDLAGEGNYSYGLRGKTVQYYEFEDFGTVLEDIFWYAGTKGTNAGGGTTGTTTPVYNAVFGLNPYNFGFSTEFPTKRVTLYLSTGVSHSPYGADSPTSFSLNIQATIFPSRYVSDILKATT